MSRTLKGKHATSLGLLSAALLTMGSACDGSVADYAEICASKTNPPHRVESRQCNDPNNKGVGKYAWQLPKDNDDGSYGTMIVPNVGQPIAGGSWGAAPVGKDPARVIKPPSYSGNAKVGSTISRGGLGVSGYGSASGS